MNKTLKINLGEVLGQDSLSTTVSGVESGTNLSEEIVCLLIGRGFENNLPLSAVGHAIESVFGLQSVLKARVTRLQVDVTSSANLDALDLVVERQVGNKSKIERVPLGQFSKADDYQSGKATIEGTDIVVHSTDKLYLEKTAAGGSNPMDVGVSINLNYSL